MDDGRVSYKEAVEAIRQFGYLGIERNEDVVILYADDIPYASVKNTNYPLRTWDYECHDWITLENCRTIEDVVWHFNNGDCTLAEKRYKILITNGLRPEQARCVLPLCLKTEIVVTANYREWRNIFKLRTPVAAHPQMRELMCPLLHELQKKIPVVFDDIQTLWPAEDQTRKGSMVNENAAKNV